MPIRKYLVSDGQDFFYLLAFSHEEACEKIKKSWQERSDLKGKNVAVVDVRNGRIVYVYFGG